MSIYPFKYNLKIIFRRTSKSVHTNRNTSVVSLHDRTLKWKRKSFFTRRETFDFLGNCFHYLLYELYYYTTVPQNAIMQ